jgi:seryl-tRNA synthetase
MRNFLIAATTLAFAAFAVQANTNNFQNIIGDAAKIQMEAQSISTQLKAKSPDFESVKTKSGELNKAIQSLRSDLAAFESQNPNLTEQQKKDWELVKTKAELLLVFSDTKNSLLESGDPQKNRSMIRAYSDGIAKRAVMLQQTAKRLDR